MDLSLSPDPRVPKANKVTRRIVYSLRNWDGIFHLLNRGVTISAQSAEYDNINRLLKLDIPDDDSNYGIIDGGHTKYSIEKVIDDGQPDNNYIEQYVRLEILLGVNHILGQIASARNYSENVKEISLANYQQKLDWLKTAIHPYEDQVRWSENDPDKKMDALELIQIITAMNPIQFTNDNHPLEAYKNAGKCLDYITDEADKWQYNKLRNVALGIWKLYDTIRYRWWDLYRLPDPIAGKYGRPGRLAEVQARKRGASKLMQYVTLGVNGNPEDGDKHVEKGLAIPLLAGFRVLLEPDSEGMFYWVEDPFDFFERHGQTLIRKIMEASDQRDQNTQVVGRDKMVYQMIYESIQFERVKIELERLRQWKEQNTKS